ncbi:hypothetical protein J3F81_002148, partial [Coemansia sp. RSA 371]
MAGSVANPADHVLTGRVLELDELTVEPRQEELDELAGAAEQEDSSMLLEPEEPYMAPELVEAVAANVVDDIYYTNIAGTNEPSYYPFPPDSALLGDVTIRLPKLVKPTSMSAAFEEVLLTELLASNVSRARQRMLVDKMNVVMQQFMPGCAAIRHMEIVFQEKAQDLVLASRHYYYGGCGCKLLCANEECDHCTPPEHPKPKKQLRYLSVHHQLAAILYSAAKAEMLPGIMTKTPIAPGKELVTLDMVNLSFGADGFNATKATSTSMSACAIRVLNLPLHIQNRSEFMVLPVILPQHADKQDEASFLRPIFDDLYNLEQRGLRIETDDMIIQARLC